MTANHVTADHARSSPRIVRIPVHRTLVPFAAACLIGALLTDLMYWRTAVMMWSDFSAWLVSVGVVLGWLAVFVGLFDYFSGYFAHPAAPAWPVVTGYVAALILSTLNMFVHTHDAWTSVVPWGLILSALTVVILLVSAWMGRPGVDRYGVEVAG